jgi:hypothetical protein
MCCGRTVFEPEPLVLDACHDLDELRAAADIAARHWSLSAPELMRVGQNAVFTAGDLILRVSIATAPMDVAIRFAERLTAEGVRAARPARPDWVASGRLSVTAWERIDADPCAAVDWEQVGAMVARVHAIDPNSVDHPLPFCADFPWWRFDDTMAMASTVDEVAATGMRAALAEHRWWIDAGHRAGPLVLLHGDVHPGNVLVDVAGPVLIDWDLLCVGPPEWDHAALSTWADRWGGQPGLYEMFASGADEPLDDRRLGAIAELRLLAATLMRLKRAAVEPAAAAEAQCRLAYWRGDPTAPQWQAQ